MAAFCVCLHLSSHFLTVDVEGLRLDKDDLDDDFDDDDDEDSDDEDDRKDKLSLASLRWVRTEIRLAWNSPISCFRRFASKSSLVSAVGKAKEELTVRCSRRCHCSPSLWIFDDE